MKFKVVALVSMSLIILLASCQSDEEIEFKRYYTLGRLVYQSRCQNCHGDNGAGLSALIPPLTDSAYLKNNRVNLACFIKYGLKGPLMVKGKSFEGDMNAIDLAPVEIAQVITYVNNSFGNKLGVTTSQQASAFLNQCK